MKAERRKELQTNVLADRMGRLAQQVKSRPRRSLVVILLVLLVAGGGWVFNQWRKGSASENSELWVKLDDGQKKYIDELKGVYPTQNVGKAARFQFAWLAFWNQGVKLMGGDSKLAHRNINLAKRLYLDLREECKDDQVWEPEALYHLAVIEETLAAYDRDHLKEAQKLYNDLASHAKYQDSAYGQMARERGKLLERDSREGKYDDIVRFYQDLQNRLKLQIPELPADKK